MRYSLGPTYVDSYKNQINRSGECAAAPSQRQPTPVKFVPDTCKLLATMGLPLSPWQHGANRMLAEAL